jgi:UDP-N-acetylmuramyl-tripeptide synthetase
MHIIEIIKNHSQVGSKFLNLEFNDIQIDSRLVKKNDIFFALDSKGIKFIDDAIKKGAILVICPKSANVQNNLCIDSENIAEDLVYALKKKYQPFPKNIFAVTGTKGKSSIANFFIQFMDLLGKKSASIGTLGLKSNVSEVEKLAQFSPLTTPDIVSIYHNLSILKENQIDDLIIEASSIGLDQGRLEGIEFSSGIFTNLSLDHLDYHPDMVSYLACKMKLFKENLSSGKAIINADCEEFKKVCNAVAKTNNKISSFGLNGKNLQFLKITSESWGHKIKFSLNDEIFESEINLLGEFQIYNILATLLLIVESYKLTQEETAKLIKNFNNLKAAQGRMQLVFSGDYKIYLDFAHNPESLEKSLFAVKDNAKKLFVLFGCGGDRDKGKRPQMGKIATQIADFSIITDDNPRTENPILIRQNIISGCVVDKFIEIFDRKIAIIEAIKKLKKGDILVIAGKGHEKYQIIGNKKFEFDEEKIVNEFLSHGENH